MKSAIPGPTAAPEVNGMAGHDGCPVGKSEEKKRKVGRTHRTHLESWASLTPYTTKVEGHEESP
jgi:hypothetical protein